MIKISVIIPTYNGAHKVINLLRALENQTYKDFETIVVIDGSTDNTYEILKSTKFKLNSIKLIIQTNKGRATVRNRGAEEASGDLLIFFDDDMLPVENCIDKHIEHHKFFHKSILTGSSLDDKSKVTTDIQLYKAYLSEIWSAPLKLFKGKPLVEENIFITAANFSILRNLFFELNGFDANLNDAEDYDLAVRAFQKGTSLFYNHEAFAWHIDPITCRSYIRRQREYKAMHKRLIELKPELYSKFPLRSPRKISGIKMLIYKSFTYKFWIYTVDHFNWLMVLPKKVRYRIYDLIITANGILFPERVKLN